MLARIYQPPKSATQSGLARTKRWVLEFEPSVARSIEPLMGWTSSEDMNQQVVLEFETMEEAVRRETVEEAGITTGRVSYFRSQPWPFPMSLMIGAFAEALTSDITIDRTELEDARWFTREELALMLQRRHPDRITTPPPVAIAHHIIRAFVEDGPGVLS